MFEKTGLELYHKLSDNVFKSLFSLFCIFQDAKAELYLVGGCVRDLLLDNKTPKDYDLCTNLTPDQVKELLAKENKEAELEADLDEGEVFDNYPYSFIDTGLKHGTITVHDKWKDLFYEITTYRVDGKYSDGRHPDEVVFTPSLEEDLKRRDFTINSFAYNMTKDKLIMLDETFLYDLKFGVIRTVGDPTERFTEDALRMLRAIRFSAQLNFSIEKETYEALYKCTHLLSHISKERIRDELTKILLSDNPQKLELFILTELEYFAFDGYCPLREILECEHQNPWHYTDVFHHTVDVIKGCPKTFVLRWAALFHDLGKPKVKALKEGTTDHYRYIGHPEVSVEIADKLMELLKFSNDDKELIHKFVLYHDYPLSTVSNKKFKQKIVELGEESFLAFLQLRQADALAHKLSMSTSFAIDAVSICKDRFVKYLMNPEPMRLKDLAINGNDIKADGFLQGKEIGDCLNWMLNIVLEHPEYNTKEKLLEYLQVFKEMSFQSS